MLPALAAAGCSSDSSRGRPAAVASTASALSLDQAAQETCGTPDELVAGLSRQLVDAIECLRPGTLGEIPLDETLHMLSPDRPNLLDTRAIADLRAAAAAGDRPMVVRWGYRDVGLQQLFWLQDQYQGCAVAARPGNSNHQNGLAVDLDDWQYWEPIMRAHGWENNLANDRVHFDYQRASDIGLGPFSLYAFQELWNANHPEATLPLSGELDAETDEALASADLEGLPDDLCRGARPPARGPDGGPLTVGQLAWRTCGAAPSVATGLGAQVARAMNCLSPDSLVDLAEACPGCARVTYPVAQGLASPDVTAALARARAGAGRVLPLDWAFRDVATEHALALALARRGCGETPGAAHSALNSGLGVTAADAATAAALRNAGFAPVAAEGPLVLAVAGEDRTTLGVQAFQRLWNLNHPAPADALVEDGRIGPATRSAIERAPATGFPDEVCPGVEPPPPPPDAEPPSRDAEGPADATSVGPEMGAGGRDGLDADGSAGVGDAAGPLPGGDGEVRQDVGPNQRPETGSWSGQDATVGPEADDAHIGPASADARAAAEANGEIGTPLHTLPPGASGIRGQGGCQVGPGRTSPPPWLPAIAWLAVRGRRRRGPGID